MKIAPWWYGENSPEHRNEINRGVASSRDREKTLGVLEVNAGGRKKKCVYRLLRALARTLSRHFSSTIQQVVGTFNSYTSYFCGPLYRKKIKFDYTYSVST